MDQPSFRIIAGILLCQNKIDPKDFTFFLRETDSYVQLKREQYLSPELESWLFERRFLFKNRTAYEHFIWRNITLSEICFQIFYNYGAEEQAEILSILYGTCDTEEELSLPEKRLEWT